MRDVVTTYDELKGYLEFFANGHSSLMVICGSPGIAKSHLAASILPHGDQHGNWWIYGKSTAYALYLDLHAHRNSRFIIDDNDELYRNRDTVVLLKQVCQTEGSRTVSWNTMTTKPRPSGKTAELDATIEDEAGEHPEVQEDLSSFDTKSPVLILVNQWETLNKHVAAVVDRGTQIQFIPDASEVHQYVGTWKDTATDGEGTLLVDPDVYDFIGDHLPLVFDPSIRPYVQASRYLRGGLPWKEKLLKHWEADTPVGLIVRLESDERLTTERARQEAWSSQTGLSRTRYFEIKARLGRPKRKRGRKPVKLTLLESDE